MLILPAGQIVRSVTEIFTSFQGDLHVDVGTFLCWFVVFTNAPQALKAVGVGAFVCKKQVFLKTISA